MNMFACFVLTLAVGGQGPEPATPPLIVTGWDAPTPRQFRENLAAFERWGVFDGTTIRPTRTTASGERDARHAFSRDPWTWDEFAGSLENLKNTHPTTCRENFLALYANPGDVDWFDDEGWKEIVHHWRLMARLAHRGGLRGILYDAEPYTKPHSQFLYRAQPQHERHSFAEYCAQARRRGREVMEAVREEFPEITVFTYRLFSDMLGVLKSGDLMRGLETHTYGLQPAFIDGWLDRMTPEMRVIEGTEDIGYRANSEEEYNTAFTRLRLQLHRFLDPEHREKVRQQFRIGQSLYLDAYVNPPGNAWHIDHKGTSAASRLAANTASALAASDGVVWLYGEKARWWPNRKGKHLPMWPEKLIGAVDALRRAKDPSTFARTYFRSHPDLENLIVNGDFSKSKSPTGPPEGWFTWQAETSKGQWATDAERAVMDHMSEGVIGQAVPVKPAEVYVFRIRVKSVGRASASLNLGWKSASQKWTGKSGNRRFVATEPPDAQGWSEIIGWAEVPKDAASAIVMPGVRQEAGGRCWFDDAQMSRIP